MSNTWTTTTNQYMIPIQGYILLEEDSLDKMNTAISCLIKKGWRPHGSPTMDTPDGMADYYLQGMILYGEDQDHND